MDAARVRAVTANVESRLDRPAARGCLDAALDLDPDVTGLQEWSLPRVGLLRDSGVVHLGGTPVVLPSRRGSRLTWVASAWGDCVLGVRTERYAVLRHRQRLLSLPAYADPGSRRPPVLPPRWATVAELADRADGGRIGVVVFHLVPGAQRSGRYREDRPRTTAQHRAEVAALQRTVDDLVRHCASVWVLGDTNFHGLTLAGVTSAWAGRPPGEGTLTSYRRVDDVFGPGSADRVELFHTASDHRMVLVERGVDP